MSVAGSTADGADDAGAVAAALREASIACIVASADGDSLAAAGLLATACAEIGTPYHVSVERTRGAIQRRVTAADGDATPIVIGATNPAGPAIVGATPASATAFEAAQTLDASPDPLLALAGTTARETPPDAAAGTRVIEAARDAGIELTQRPGVAIPTADLVDGFAHTTLAHAPFSGDSNGARTALTDAGVSTTRESNDPERDERVHRTVASLFALAATDVEEPAAASRAAGAIERALRPYAIENEGPFATVGGYADVLNALAWRAPGTGVALALGGSARTAALDAWRAHARTAHAAVRSAETARYSGLLIARIDENENENENEIDDPETAPENVPVGTIARLVRDFRSPEPAVLVVGRESAAAAAVDAAVGDAIEGAAAAVDGEALGRRTRGYARFGEQPSPDEFVTAFREALTP